MISEKGVRPLVIITPELDAYFTGNEAAMEYWGTDEVYCSKDKKLSAIIDFMKEHHYEQVFANRAFVIYE